MTVIHCVYSGSRQRQTRSWFRLSGASLSGGFPVREAETRMPTTQESMRPKTQEKEKGLAAVKSGSDRDGRRRDDVPSGMVWYMYE